MIKALQQWHCKNVIHMDLKIEHFILDMSNPLEPVVHIIDAEHAMLKGTSTESRLFGAPIINPPEAYDPEYRALPAAYR